MGFPIRSKLVLLNGGEHQGVSALALSEVFSAEGSKNVRIPKPGIVRSVNGYRRLTGAAVLTQNGDAARGVGLRAFVSRAGGVVTRKLVGVFTDENDEVEIHHADEDGLGWEFLYSVSDALGLIPQLFQFGNKVIICFGGSVEVLEYDGTAVTLAGQVQPETPTVATGVTGNLIGTFKYKAAKIDADGNVGPASEITEELTVYLKTVDVSDIELGDNGARIYRTLGDGDTYFWNADVTTDTYNDNVTDASMLATNRLQPNDGTPPPVGARFGMQHHARALYLGTPELPNNFYFGDVGRPDSVPADNNDPVGEGDEGDKLIAGWPEYEGVAILCKTESIWTLSGDGRNTYQLNRSQAQTGVVGKNALGLLPGGVQFVDHNNRNVSIAKPVLVYMTPENDVRVFDGVTDAIISAPQTDRFAAADFTYRETAWVQVFPEYNWVLFGIPKTSSGFDVVALDYKQGTWHPVDAQPDTSALALVQTSTQTSALLALGSKKGVGGHCYQMFDGDDAAGASYEATIRTIPLTHGNPLHDQVLRAVASIFEKEETGMSVDLNVYNGFADLDAAAFSTHSISIQTTAKNFTDIDAVQTKDGDAEYPMAPAQVLEWTRTGTGIWGFAGFATYRQDVQQPYKVSSS